MRLRGRIMRWLHCAEFYERVDECFHEPLVDVPDPFFGNESLHEVRVGAGEFGQFLLALVNAPQMPERYGLINGLPKI